MKKAQKRLTALLVIVLSLTIVLAGCSSGKKDAGSSAAPAVTDSAATVAPAGEATAAPADATVAPTTAAAVDVSTLKPVKLRFIYPGGPQPDQAAVTEAMNKILTAKINATISVEPIDWGQWDQKVNLMIASREKFDVMFTAQWNGHAANVTKGAFLALNDDALPKYGNLLAKYGQGIIASQDPNFLKGAEISGKNYAIPTTKELAAVGGLIYRSDIAKELGLDMSVIKTIQDLEGVLTVVKTKKPEMTPLFLRDGDNLDAHYFVQRDTLGDATIPGVILKDQPSTTVVSKLDLPRYKEYADVSRNLMKKGLVNKDAATVTTSGQDAMKAGNVFMIPASLKPGKDAELAAGLNLVGKLTQIDMTPATISTAEPAGSMLGISSTSDDPERSMMLINLLHTDKDLNNLLNFGIDGTHYAKVNENVIKATDGTKNYNPGAAWMFGNQFLNYLHDNEDPNKWDLFKTFNASAKASPALGFTFDPASVKTEVAAAANVQKEFDAAIETGSIDFDTAAPKYAAKLKSAGVDKILAEKQKQLDAFLAAKK